MNSCEYGYLKNDIYIYNIENLLKISLTKRTAQYRIIGDEVIVTYREDQKIWDAVSRDQICGFQFTNLLHGVCMESDRSNYSSASLINKSVDVKTTVPPSCAYSDYLPAVYQQICLCGQIVDFSALRRPKPTLY